MYFDQIWSVILNCKKLILKLRVRINIFKLIDTLFNFFTHLTHIIYKPLGYILLPFHILPPILLYSLFLSSLLRERETSEMASIPGYVRRNDAKLFLDSTTAVKGGEKRKNIIQVKETPHRTLFRNIRN